MGTTSEKLQYLATTKTLLKNKINLTGANITTDTFRQYPTKLQNALLDVWNNEGEPIFTNWGNKVNGEGTNVKLDNTLNARMKITPKGNTTQNGTPTPSSPIDVNVVSGDNEVKIEGKNLYNYTKFSVASLSGITATNNNGVITCSGTSTATSFLNISTSNGGIDLKANTQYTLSAKNTTALTSNDQLRLMDSNGTTISGAVMVLNTTNAKVTFTLSSDMKVFLQLRFGSGETLNNFVITPQLEKGNTQTEYEPYTSQNYPLYLGVENLLRITTFTDNSITKTSNGITATINTNGSISVNGTATANTNIYFTKNNFTLSGKFYYLCNSPSANARIELTCKVNGTTKYLNDYGTGNFQDASTSFEFNSLTLIVASGTTVNTTFEPMVALGTKVNSYTPYGTTPIELCKIGTCQDYIYKTDKWYLHKEIGKLVLNGSNGSTEMISVTQGNLFRTKNLLTNSLNMNTIAPLSNNYHGIASNNFGTLRQNNDIYIVWQSTNEQWVDVIDNAQNSTQNWQTWLSNNNTNLYYVLATPTEEEITNTTLINQLEALKGAMSYEGQTNINGGFMIVGASALGVM